MEQMGFNPEASFEAKKAFIKYLIKEAHFEQNLRARKNKLQIAPLEEPATSHETPGEQLSFFAPTGSDSK